MIKDKKKYWFLINWTWFIRINYAEFSKMINYVNESNEKLAKEPLTDKILKFIRIWV